MILINFRYYSTKEFGEEAGGVDETKDLDLGRVLPGGAAAIVAGFQARVMALTHT